MTIVLCALSCTREVPYIPEEAADRLILNAQIDASGESHKAWIGVSKTSTITKLDGATLSCSVNGKLVSQGSFDEDLSRNAVQSCFLFDAELHPGDVVRLSANGAGLSAYAEVTVPDTTGRLLGVDMRKMDSALEFTAHVKDDDAGRNYYRIRLQTASYQSFFIGHGWSPWDTHIVEEDLTHRNDPILDERIGGSIGDDFYGIGNNTNHYCVFTDKSFAGAEAEISFSINKWISEDDFYGNSRVVIDEDVSLVSMDQAEFDYLSILNVLYDNSFESYGMLEPITVPSNVVGGTGFVGVFLPSTVSIRLLEKL